MPYELDRPALMQAIADINQKSPDAAILVPWAYTDFSFLYVMSPSEPIYCVYSPRGLSVPEPLIDAWHKRYRLWYGDRYLHTVDSLKNLLMHRPLYYLGWHRYPPLEFAQRIAANIGFDNFAQSLSGINAIDHLETGWVLDIPELTLEPAGREGQYEFFLIRMTKASVLPTPLQAELPLTDLIESGKEGKRDGPER